jgi:hypothetical protein
MRLGILPAGGKATRFGGLDKTLSCIIGTQTLLSINYEGLRFFCDHVIVVTSATKVFKQIAQAEGATFMIDTEGMWSAMLRAMEWEADEYYFLMADTFVCPPRPPYLSSDFMLGTFESDAPRRFGRFVDGKIINKHDSTGLCWGTGAWSKEVRDYWREVSPPDYTEAFNLAITKFGLETFPLDYYYDIASEEDYVQLLNNV